MNSIIFALRFGFGCEGWLSIGGAPRMHNIKTNAWEMGALTNFFSM